MIYATTCADLSEEFINSIPCATTEEKLVHLSTKLQIHFPHLTLQCCQIGVQFVYQVKGAWNDVKSCHELLNDFNSASNTPEPSKELASNIVMDQNLEQTIKSEFPIELSKNLPSPGNLRFFHYVWMYDVC